MDEITKRLERQEQYIKKYGFVYVSRESSVISDCYSFITEHVWAHISLNKRDAHWRLSWIYQMESEVRSLCGAHLGDLIVGLDEFTAALGTIFTPEYMVRRSFKDPYKWDLPRNLNSTVEFPRLLLPHSMSCVRR